MAEKICSIDGCEKKVKHRGWCSAHYERWRKYGSVYTVYQERDRTCSIEECDRKHAKYSYCSMHALRYKRHGDPLGAAKPRPIPNCSLEDCNNKNYGRGLCNKHYLKWFHYGDPYAGWENFPFPDNIWNRLVETEDGCWEWQGMRNGKGYGHAWDGESVSLVHRIVYQLKIGEITDNLPLDHLCANPPCANPDHLEPVTNEENLRRGSKPHF